MMCVPSSVWQCLVTLCHFRSDDKRSIQSKHHQMLSDYKLLTKIFQNYIQIFSWIELEQDTVLVYLMAQWNSLRRNVIPKWYSTEANQGGTVHQLLKWRVCHQSMLRFLTQRVVGIVLVLRNLIGPVYGSATWICYTIAEGTWPRAYAFQPPILGNTEGT